jgi:hypothetical protein
MRTLILVATLISWPVVAASGSILVNPDGSGDFATIQAAIDASSDGDVIILADGTFVGDGNRDLDYGGRAITVRSESGDPEGCVLDVQGSSTEPHRGVTFQSAETSESILQGVTIRGGGILGDGGAVLCAGTAAPYIVNFEFRDNFAWRGGGMACIEGSAPFVESCTVVSNSVSEAGRGGGIACLDASSPSFLRCTIADNAADEFFGGGAGGGIYSRSSASIVECVVSGNSAYGNFGGSGGGVYADASTLIVRSWITDNEADSGGGISGSPRIEDSLITGNSCAPGYGGGILGAPILIGCTIAGNTALSIGGGLYSDQTVEMERTILWGNCVSFPGEGGEDAWIHGAGELVVTCSDFDPSRIAGTGSITWVADNISIDPLFCDAADCAESDGDFTLHQGSMCLPASSPCGQLIGALGQGGGGSVPTEVMSWGGLKRRFR